ncbi:Chalcone-flavanone isomerase family protein [Euphorbia peplus]|nr:Chalcone-flavanone isomerase family protein [Euphorbia peplus]
MVSLRFPFLFSQPKITPPPFPATAIVACTIVAGAATFSGIEKSSNRKHPFVEKALDLLLPVPSDSSSLPWGSLSLADASSVPVVESKTGASFPSVILESRRLLGIGLRKKSVLGLKNIHVYAFGVYADDNEVRNVLGEKNGKLSISELMEGDIPVTVRLQIVYSKLSIRSVRNAFEESIGSRLEKFGGPDNKELLQRFTSLFKDEYKIPRGSVIELSREQGHVLRTTIDGKEVGSIKNKLLCRSILDLYIGEDPFDRKAKEEIESALTSLFQE